MTSSSDLLAGSQCKGEEENTCGSCVLRYPANHKPAGWLLCNVVVHMINQSAPLFILNTHLLKASNPSVSAAASFCPCVSPTDHRRPRNSRHGRRERTNERKAEEKRVGDFQLMLHVHISSSRACPIYRQRDEKLIPDSARF